MSTITTTGIFRTKHAIADLIDTTDLNSTGNAVLKNLTVTGLSSIPMPSNPSFSGDVNVGGNLTVVGTATAGVTHAGSLTASTATLSGTLSAPSATIAGALSSGAITAPSATLSGILTASGVTVTGPLVATTATLSGALSAPSATIAGTASMGNLTATGANITGPIFVPSAVIAGTVSAASLSSVNTILNTTVAQPAETDETTAQIVFEENGNKHFRLALIYDSGDTTYKLATQQFVSGAWKTLSLSFM